MQEVHVQPVTELKEHEPQPKGQGPQVFPEVRKQPEEQEEQTLGVEHALHPTGHPTQTPLLRLLGERHCRQVKLSVQVWQY